MLAYIIDTIGIHISCIQLIKSYLSDRHQFVELNKCTSYTYMIPLTGLLRVRHGHRFS